MRSSLIINGASRLFPGIERVRVSQRRAKGRERRIPPRTCYHLTDQRRLFQAPDVVSPGDRRRVGAQTGQTCRNRCYNVAAASFADPTF
jgi:hypothetical protein